MTIDLSAIEEDVNLAESVATELGPLLAFIPGLGPYVGAIVAAIPQIVKATRAVEQVIGTPVDSVATAQTVADHIDPNKPAVPALSEVKS